MTWSETSWLVRLVKEGAGEDGGVEEALDIRISICSMFEAFEIGHWTSSSHPHPPSPLHGIGKLKLHSQNENHSLKRESRLVEAPKECNCILCFFCCQTIYCQNTLLPRDSDVNWLMISDGKRLNKDTHRFVLYLFIYLLHCSCSRLEQDKKAK